MHTQPGDETFVEICVCCGVGSVEVQTPDDMVICGDCLDHGQLDEFSEFYDDLGVGD